MRILRLSVYFMSFMAITPSCKLPDSMHQGTNTDDSNQSSMSGLSMNRSWQFQDNGGANTARIGGGVSFATFNSKLYGIWHEGEGPFRINVSVFDPSSSRQHWSSVGGVTGLNWDPSVEAVFGKLAVANSKLYATWYETNSTEQIRVAVYNGDDLAPAWSLIDGNRATGLNLNPTMHAFNPTLVGFNSKLYIAWNEETASNTEAVRVAVYNGNDSSPSWSFIDGGGASGLNYDSSKSG